MVAIGRALMSNPRLLMCDELSLGLAPMVIGDIYDDAGRVRERGITLIVVEQNVAAGAGLCGPRVLFSGRAGFACGRPRETDARTTCRTPISGLTPHVFGDRRQHHPGHSAGGLYGLFAAGLSLVFGVMRLVNVAHGDFIVLAAFLALALQNGPGIGSPFGATAGCRAADVHSGYVLQRYVLNPTLGADILRPVLVTFGLSVIAAERHCCEVFSADSRKLQGGWLEMASMALPGGLAHRRVPSAHARRLRGSDRRAAVVMLYIHAPGRGLPRHLRRSDGRRADGGRYPSSVQHRHGHRHGDCGYCRPCSWASAPASILPPAPSS